MKVLHVIPSLSLADGGPTRAIAAMERALSDQGVTVETAATDDDGPGRHNGKPLAQPLQENGVTRRYFAKRTEFYKASPAFARWIRSEVRGYDLVHIHALFSFTSIAAARAARRAGVPYVVRPLGTLNDYGMRRRRPWLKALSLRFVDGPLLRDAAAVHFTSHEEAAQARRLGLAVKEAVIPLGIGQAPQRAVAPRLARYADLSAAGPRLLYLSRLDPKKNLEGLLAAVALLTPEMPQLHLVVAGAGSPDYVNALKAQAQSLGITDRVEWPGHVEGDAKAAAFADADLFVLPSYSENFGIAAAEALAAGLPCVLGEGVAIAKDVVEAQAGIAVGTDATSIAQGLRRIIADHEALPALSANAMRLARERYSIDAMGANLKRLYEEILKR
jgi:glycosyltransferase involved in cell wall biosynthesis